MVPPTRRGFGTSLLSATFSDIKLDYLPTGLSCQIRLPSGRAALDDKTAEGGAAHG